MVRSSALILLVALAMGAKNIVMNPETRMFQDTQGRTVIFHGVNAVVKGAPYIPVTDHFDPQMSISAEDIQNMQEWGFNFVRLGVMWESVERKPQWYNATYLDEMEKIVNSLGEAGIVTLVDAHQDVFARHICGEGMPDFYATNLKKTCSEYGPWGSFMEWMGKCKPFSSYNYTLDDNGDPIIPDCLSTGFGAYYNTPESNSAFARVYNNVDGLQDRFVDFWKVVVKQFADNPYAIGYDPINEPELADSFAEPELTLPGVFDNKKLQPLYQRFNDEIRPIDQEGIIFFEPTPNDVYMENGGFIFPSGFTATPGGPDLNKYQVFNEHTYCCQAGADICSTGEPALEYKELCRRFHNERVGIRAEDAKKLNVGMMITEFGACTNSDACAQEITLATEASDANLAGWAYWMFKGFGDFTTSGNTTEGLYGPDGKVEEIKLKSLVRTYVQAYQGVPEQFTFDTESAHFQTTFEVDGSITAPTLLYYNQQYYYPNGYELKVQCATCTYTVEDKNSYTVAITFGQDSTGKVEILFTPKA